MTDATRNRTPAFTLVELLVVVAIIGILIAVLLPAFGTVRNQAKFAAGAAQYKAIEQGIEMFRGEDALGATVPPSRSDNRQGAPLDHHEIASPFADDDSTTAVTTGANLLVYALLGADLLGTPGFKDLNRNGTWWDDMHRQPPANNDRGGLYYIDPDDGALGHTRYGGSGFVDEKMRDRVTNLNALKEAGSLLSLNVPSGVEEADYNQPLFLDPWDKPVLYYKANPAAKLMVSSDVDPDERGIYHHDDNGLITGTEGAWPGVDFGQGRMEGTGDLHAIKKAGVPPTAVDAGFPNNPAYDHTFSKFIHDKSVKRVHTPVRKDTYLLISAGADGRYGTSDDLTNWERQSN